MLDTIRVQRIRTDGETARVLKHSSSFDIPRLLRLSGLSERVYTSPPG